MIEVFKTDVSDKVHADQLIDCIQNLFDYKVNFDLEDCDKILRVECRSKSIDTSKLIDLLKASGFKAEVL